MTARKFEGMLATVFAIAVVSGLVYAQVSKVDIYQGIASVTGRTLGFGCQLRVYRTAGRVGGFVPSVSPNSFFEEQARPMLIRPQDLFFETQSNKGSESLVIRFQKASSTDAGHPVEYEYHRGSSPETAVYCRDLEFEVSGKMD